MATIDTTFYESRNGHKPRGLDTYTFTVSFPYVAYGTWSEARREIEQLTKAMKQGAGWAIIDFTAELDT
jgi:hypothetical protein